MSLPIQTTASRHPDIMAAPNRRIPSLDGLRGIAILFVLCSHLWHSLPLPSRIVGRLRPFLDDGDIGVNMFFVLSGYLITTLLLKELGKTGTIRLKHFYIRRAFRIWPAFYAYIGLVSLFVLAGVLHITWSGIALAATFLWNFRSLFVRDAGPDHGACGHIWTLSIEEQFYLFWPVALLLLKPKHSAYFACGLILITPVIRVGVYLLFPALRPYISGILNTRIDFLMFGCLAALLSGSQRFAQTFRRKVTGPMVALSTIMIFLIDPMLYERFKGMYLLPVGYTIEGLCSTIILLWAVRAEGVVGTLLNAKPLVHIGVISYSLYLWQQLFTNVQTPVLGRFPLNLICCLIAAELSYIVIERPFLRLRQRAFP
jgi:peptidoglycan/LPS O-acetylase OafA/YrhL